MHNDDYAALPEPVCSPALPDTTGNVSGMAAIPLSVLDLAPITLGSTPGDALRNSLDLARHAERLGYRRYWVAEHHNMPGHRERRDGGRRSATSPAGTSTIRSAPAGSCSRTTRRS